jgi:signal transduction histidine kinase
MKGLLPQLERACAHGGETGALIRALDWSQTPLGPIGSWPSSLQVTVSICLRTKFPMAINWGGEFTQIYNDAARQVYGKKHPMALGRPARTNFPEFWQFTQLEQTLEFIRQTEVPFHAEDQWVPLERWGFREETFFTFGLSPLVDDEGVFCGVLNTFIETTNRVLGERRLATLRLLAEHAARAGTIEDGCRRAMVALATNPRDLRFVLLYVADNETGSLVLKGSSGIAIGAPASPLTVPLHEVPPPGSFAWPLERVLASNEAQIVDGLERINIAAALETPPPPMRKRSPPERAVVLPLAHNGDGPAAGALIVGLSPRLVHDDAYLGFVSLLANQLTAALAGTRAHQEARERAEKLAQLDRAKSVFYSNISHEFRTPLTLLLAPVEDMLSGKDGAVAPPAMREGLETVRRNALRLLKLVNGLLDVARIEAGRMELRREPTDLAALTREVVSAFELATRRAMLALAVSCPPLPGPVYVDADGWEKIVSNLVSNALKYTQKGKITVTLRALEGRVELVVRDTGVGISADDLPHIFERFYRIGGVQGRSVEGAGIGLALVDALVRLHGGTIKADSTLGDGTTITVTMPIGSPSAAAAHATAAHEPERLLGTAPWVEEAAGWLDERGRGTATTSAAPTAAPAVDGDLARRRILIVEDNSDMRHYLVSLLAPHYDIQARGNGSAALAAAGAQTPDLVLSDILMPGLDGFALLRALRADTRTHAVPVLLISAQAGEEAALEGLGSGADDYLRKPFSARELLARVRTHLQLAEARRAAAEYEMMDVFLGIVSHELRTPVTTLKLVVQRLRRELGETGSSLAERLARLTRSIGRIELLVEDIVSVAAIKSGQLTLSPGPHDLAAICRAGAEEQGVPSGPRIVLDLPDEPIVATIDEGRILQVVCNLLSNARKFSPANHPVTLTLRRRGELAHLTVRDEGPGIARAEVPHIFERFHRVPGIKVQTGSKTGLGLGLYISKGIVEQHDGRIWVETEEGHGSTFHVLLPLKPTLSQPAAADVGKECDG